VVTNNNMQVQWRVIGTASYNVLHVYTHNYALLTLGSGFLGCYVCTCQPIIINCVVALQLVAWALLGNHCTTITIACGYSKRL